MRIVYHKSRRDVRHDLKAAFSQALRQLYRRIDALGRRGCHRELDLGRNVPDDLLLDPLEGDHLISRAAQEPYYRIPAAGVERGSQCAPGESHGLDYPWLFNLTSCLGVSLVGSVNGFGTTTADLHPDGVSTSSSVFSSVSSTGTMA